MLLTSTDKQSNTTENIISCDKKVNMNDYYESEADEDALSIHSVNHKGMIVACGVLHNVRHLM